MNVYRMPHSSLVQPFQEFHISRNSTISPRGCSQEHHPSQLSTSSTRRQAKAAAAAAAADQASRRYTSYSPFDYELPRRRTMEDDTKPVTSSRSRHYYAQGLPHVPDPPTIESGGNTRSSSRTGSPAKLPSAPPSRRSSPAGNSPSADSQHSARSHQSAGKRLARLDPQLCSLCGDLATLETAHLWFQCHNTCQKSICIACIEDLYQEFIVNPSDSAPQCSLGEPLAFTLEDFSSLGQDKPIHDILAAYEALKYKLSVNADRCCTSSSCLIERGPTQLRVASSGRKWRVCLGCRSRYCAFCLRDIADAEVHEASPGRDCRIEDVVRRVRYEARTEKVDKQLQYASGYISRTRGEGSGSRA